MEFEYAFYSPGLDEELSWHPWSSPTQLDQLHRLEADHDAGPVSARVAQLGCHAWFQRSASAAPVVGATAWSPMYADDGELLIPWLVTRPMVTVGVVVEADEVVEDTARFRVSGCLSGELLCEPFRMPIDSTTQGLKGRLRELVGYPRHRPICWVGIGDRACSQNRRLRTVLGISCGHPKRRRTASSSAAD